jgi:phage terminase Nu1 subunit (DNA packaging protein)
VRLETIRDGLEDCEMFRMADEALGREWVLAKIKAVTSDLKNYTESGEFFTAVRNEIGNELEKALNK